MKTVLLTVNGTPWREAEFAGWPSQGGVTIIDVNGRMATETVDIEEKEDGTFVANIEGDYESFKELNPYALYEIER